jgi:hypothetical protein
LEVQYTLNLEHHIEKIIRGYKYHYVLGGCGLHCASDMKYGVREWESIQGIPSLVNCLERKETFECHPSPLLVYTKVLEIVSNI